MTAHIFLPGIRLRQLPLLPEHDSYLREWHATALEDAEHDDICASICLQAAFIELTRDGRVTTDWLGLFDECLTGPSGWPIAYSEKYGARLHGFANQTVQSTIVAVHTRWWLEVLRAQSGVDHERYGRWLLEHKRKNGLLYDYDISETTLRHRMRTELAMSMAYGLEILHRGSLIDGALRDDLLASLTDARRCGPSRYMSAEYFRLQALRMLNAVHHFPVAIEGAIDACAKDLNVGFADFAMADKADSYMGTAKRTERDKPIHSPLSACHVAALLTTVAAPDAKTRIQTRVADYCAHLQARPLDIPSFQMRDVPIPFGVGKTPIEVLCAAHLLAGEVRP